MIIKRVNGAVYMGLLSDLRSPDIVLGSDNDLKLCNDLVKVGFFQ